MWERFNIPNNPGRLPLDGGGAKLVLHTTEGDFPAGAKLKMQNRVFAAFDNLHNGVHKTWMEGRGSPAHFLITPPTRRVYQYFDLHVGGVTLRDLDGPAFRPNRAGDRVVQIELVGHADSLLIEYSDEDWVWLGEQLREICKQADIPYEFADIRQGAKRMTNTEFKEFAGICGHCHVPENDHWDPGNINLDLLTSQPELPPDSNEPTKDETMWQYCVPENSNTGFIGHFDEDDFCGLLLWVNTMDMFYRWHSIKPRVLTRNQVKSMKVDVLPVGDATYTWVPNDFADVIIKDAAVDSEAIINAAVERVIQRLANG
jgi:N-acetylmuramoyl-L-alanine amidase